VCERNNNQKQLERAQHADLGRKTRADDISSDEEDHDIPFEPMIVSRTSVEGRMMTKWLDAARKVLGGTFPRPNANKEMGQYMERMRKLRLKRIQTEQENQDMKKKTQAGGEGDYGRSAVPTTGWPTDFGCIPKALAIRWVRLARDSIEKQIKNRSEKLREDLDATLAKMCVEEDWYYGASMRMEGEVHAMYTGHRALR
jgi:hypothetical protein